MISTKSEKELELMRYAGKVAYDLLELMEKEIKPGVTTKHLDDVAKEFIISKDCYPSCLGFEGYPASICTSVNESVVHEIPSKRKLKDGDIITIDVVVEYKGYMADTARTYKVGNVKKEVEDLLIHTKEALYKGIENAVAGRHLGDIGSAVQDHCEKKGYGVVRELTGHGIGREMHEDPQVPNYGRRGNGILLKSGMCLAIEPMITMGDRKIAMLPDHWSICTRDGKPAAHFEHTLAVRNGKAEVLSSFSEIEKLEANY